MIRFGPEDLRSSSSQSSEARSGKEDPRSSSPIKARTGSLFFGPAGVPAVCRTTEEGVGYVASLGLDALEIEFVHGVRMKPDEAKRIGRLASEKGVRLSAHAPYYINLNSKDRGIISRSKEHILATMRMAAALGARIIVVHAGFYTGLASPAATETIARGLEECRERADREGAKEVVLGLETMGKRASWGTFQEIRRVASRVENLYPVVDFAHLHARCGGCLRSREDFGKVLAEFDKFNAPFLHCHFTGVEFGPAGERRHLEVAAGSPDFALLAPLLRDRGYDVTLISESPLLEQDALLMKRIVGRAGER